MKTKVYFALSLILSALVLVNCTQNEKGGAVNSQVENEGTVNAQSVKESVVPDIQKIKVDLVSQRIPGDFYGCTIESISEINDLTILEKYEEASIIEYSIQAVVRKSNDNHSPFLIKGRLIYKEDNKEWKLSDNQVRVVKYNKK